MRQSFRPGVHEAPGRLRGAPLKPCPSNSPPTQILLETSRLARTSFKWNAADGASRSRLTLWVAMLRLLRLTSLRPGRDENSRSPPFGRRHTDFSDALRCFVRSKARTLRHGLQ